MIFLKQYTEETVKYLLVLAGNLFSKEANYQNILAPFQSIMHVNLSFNCARPPFKTSLKEYMNWFTLKNCSIKVQKIKRIDHQHFVDYALYSILKLTIEIFSFNSNRLSQWLRNQLIAHQIGLTDRVALFLCAEALQDFGFELAFSSLARLKKRTFH